MKKKWDEEEMGEDEGRQAIYLVCFAPIRTFATSQLLLGH